MIHDIKINNKIFSRTPRHQFFWPAATGRTEFFLLLTEQRHCHCSCICLCRHCR